MEQYRNVVILDSNLEVKIFCFSLSVYETKDGVEAKLFNVIEGTKHKLSVFVVVYSIKTEAVYIDAINMSQSTAS